MWFLDKCLSHLFNSTFSIFRGISESRPPPAAEQRDKSRDGSVTSLLVRQGLLARHRTLVVHIEQAAISDGVGPSDRGKAGGAGLNVLAGDVGARLAPLG